MSKASLTLPTLIAHNIHTQGNETLAHSDQPLKEGNVHISAPHIYGSAIEALDLVPNSCTSFLNIGSGTGYVSAIVADILGPNSLHYGEIIVGLLAFVCVSFSGAVYSKRDFSSLPELLRCGAAR